MTGATMIMRGEHVPPAMLSLAGATRHIAAERLRALAISSASRWPTLPDLPTFAELGYPDVVYLNCQGVFVAAGTSPEIVARLQDIAAVLAEGAGETSSRVCPLAESQ